MDAGGLSGSALHAVVGTSHRLRRECEEALLASWEGSITRRAAPEDPREMLLGLATPSLFGDGGELILLQADEAWCRRHQEALRPLAGQAPVAGILVLRSDRLARNLGLAKALIEAGAYHDAAGPGPREVVPWLVQRLVSGEGDVDRPREIAEALVEHHGEDPDALLGGLETARLHAGDAPLAPDDVHAVMGGEAERPVWMFTGAALEGDPARALGLLAAAPGLTPEGALQALAGEIRRMMASLENEDDRQAWRLLGRRGGNLFHSRRRGRNLGNAVLKRLIKGAGMALRDCRTGHDPQRTCEVFVLNCQRVIRSASRDRGSGRTARSRV